MNFKAALFDLDGVVIDTETQYTGFWGRVMRHYFPEQPRLAEAIKGSTLTQIFDRYFADKPDARQLITSRLNAFERQMRFDYIAGFMDFIVNLRAMHLKTALVTSSNLSKMEQVYKAHPELPKLMDAVLTAEDFDKSKPDPDSYLKAAQRLGFQPAECIGFEDSFNGLKAVRAAGMTVVGLATTNSAAAIRPYSDYVISDYKKFTIHSLKVKN